MKQLPRKLGEKIQLVSTQNWISVNGIKEFALFIDPDSLGLIESQTLTAFAKWNSEPKKDPAVGKQLAARLLYSYFKDQFDQQAKISPDFQVKIDYSVNMRLSKGNSSISSAAYTYSSMSRGNSGAPDFLISRDEVLSSQPFKPSTWDTTNYSIIGYGGGKPDRDNLLPHVFSEIAKIIAEEDSRRHEIFDKFRPEDQKGLLKQIEGFRNAGLTLMELQSKLPGIQRPNGEVDDYIISGYIPLTEFSVKIGNQWFGIGLNTEGGR
ncbi:MAG: hypothetical protein ACKVQS_08215 [Fimbriimonadaceae bacterium]